MMENIFILPGNEQELFNRYLDNNEYGPLKERLELVRKALSNKLSPDERNKHGLNVGVHELSMERKELSGRHRAAKRRNISPPLRFRTL